MRPSRFPPLALGVGVLLVALTSHTFMGSLGGDALQEIGALGQAGALVPLQWAGRLLTLGGAVAWVIGLSRQVERAAPPPPPVRRSSAPAFTGQTPRAAAVEAERRERWSEAASWYDRCSEWEAAARCYKAAYEEQVGNPRERSALLMLAAQRLWAADRHSQAVDLLVAEGQLPKALELARRAQQPAERAQLLARAGELREAAQLLVAQGDRAEAGRLLVQAGDLDGAVALLAGADPRRAAELCEQLGRPLKAAELYHRAGDLEAAAALFRSAGDLGRAAAMYQELGDHRAASDLFVQAGAPDRAGALWIASGDLQKAAEIFAKGSDSAAFGRALEAAGHPLPAAQAYAKARLPTEALRVLGGLTPAAQAEIPARLLGAQSFLALGKADRAVGILRPLLAAGINDLGERCEAVYLLGQAAEASGDSAQAVACFEQVLRLDPLYRDASLRLAPLKVALSGQPQGSGAPRRNSAGEFPLLPSRYAIDAKVGEGAMGVVYRARDSVLGRTVAVKVLGQDLVANERARAYFLREARAAGALSHPNIITVYDAGIEGNLPYLVMEFLVGTDLETLSMKGPMAVPLVVQIGQQVAEALAAVHDHQIVHRDVKPANVLLVQGTETVKLMDFGVAHLVEPGQAAKATIVAGTPDFMAPEQFVGRGLGPWTDLYALGGTTYQLLTGTVPFPDSNPAEALVPPDPRRLRPDLSPALAALVMTCLQRDPARRPPNARALAQQFASLLATRAA